MTKMALFKQQQGLCWLCDKPMTLEAASVDHIKPRAQGGTRAPHNVKLAHSKCNSIRGCVPEAEARQYVQDFLAGRVDPEMRMRKLILEGGRRAGTPKSDKPKKPGEPGYWYQKWRESRVEIPCTVIKWT